MTCRKCRVTMIEQKRVFHGRRKWICPRCGRIKFQEVKKPPSRGRVEGKKSR